MTHYSSALRRRAVAFMRIHFQRDFTRQKGDKVFCGFLDASKAFDKVLHFSLFKKLLERGVSVALVGTLKNCMAH